MSALSKIDKTAEKKIQIHQNAELFLHEKCTNKSSSKQAFVHEASISRENKRQFFKGFYNMYSEFFKHTLT